MLSAENNYKFQYRTMAVYGLIIVLLFYISLLSASRGMMFKEKWKQIQKTPTKTTIAKVDEVVRKKWKHIGVKESTLRSTIHPKTDSSKMTTSPLKLPQQILKELKERQKRKKAMNGIYVSLEEQMINTRLEIQNLRKDLSLMLPHHFKKDSRSKSLQGDVEEHLRQQNPKRVPMRPSFILEKMKMMQTDIKALGETLTTSLDSHPMQKVKKEDEKKEELKQNPKRVPRRPIFQQQMQDIRNQIETLRMELSSICFTNNECDDTSCCLVHNLIGKCVPHVRLFDQRCSNYCPCSSVEHQCKNKRHLTPSGRIIFSKHCLKKKVPEPVNTDLIMELGNAKAKRARVETEDNIGMLPPNQQKHPAGFTG